MTEPMTLKDKTWNDILRERIQLMADLAKARSVSPVAVDPEYIADLLQRCADEIAELKAQIAAMVPDHHLGQLVRQMPQDFCLSHVRSVEVEGRWFCWRAGTGPDWPEWSQLEAAIGLLVGPVPREKLETEDQV